MSCSIDKMRQMTTLCESVCVFAQVLYVLNHLEFVNCYHVCLDVHKPIIKWDNWCLSQAAGRLTHAVTGGCNVLFTAGRGRKKDGVISSPLI